MKNITNPDQTSLLLEDLIIWTNYEIEVAAYNGAGRGIYSHKVTEWTLQGGEDNTQSVMLCQTKGLPQTSRYLFPALFVIKNHHYLQNYHIGALGDLSLQQKTSDA